MNELHEENEDNENWIIYLKLYICIYKINDIGFKILFFKISIYTYGGT